MTNERDPNGPLVTSSADTTNTAPASKRVVPRPSEVHPLNAVTETPPPLDVVDEHERELLSAHDVEDRDARVSAHPRRSSAPPDRVSLVPPSRLATSLNASAAPGLASRLSQRPKAPSTTSEPPNDNTANDAARAATPSSAPIPASTRAPRPSFALTSSTTPAARPSASPSIAVSPSTSPIAPPSPSVRPLGLGRHTSLPPASLKAKGLRPTTVPPLLDKITSMNEQPVPCAALDSLQSNQLRDVILRRAQSALAHAETLADPLKKARHFVLTSELYALAGLPQTARVLAEHAAKLGNHLGYRQVRQLAQTTGDDKTASSTFASEVTSAPNAEVRRHVATAGTHFDRWVHKDALAATRNSDLLHRWVPQDPGPLLLKLARQLGQNNAPPLGLTWHPEAHQRLSSAHLSIQKLRGDAQRLAEDCKDPVATFLEVRAALERRDRVAAAKGLLKLEHEPGHERAVVWLAAALLSPVAATRDQAIELFAQLNAERSTKALRSVLAMRAVEAGNRTLLDEVVRADQDADTTQQALTSADHLAFIALGLRPNELAPWAPIAQSDSLRPLFRALAYANNATHLLTSADTDQPDERPSLAPPKTGPDLVVERLQELEAAYARDDARALGRALSALPDLASASLLSFVAATVTASAELTERQRQWLTDALSNTVCGEAALYGLLLQGPREAAPQLLETVALSETRAEHKALLLAWAALLVSDKQERVRLCMAAFAADPAHALVEAATYRYSTEPNTNSQTHEAGRHSEPPSSRPKLSNQLVSISSIHSASGRSAFERALALVRQALRSPLSTTRDTLLAHARELLPQDVTLMDLVESTNTPPPAARAQARELVLTHTNGRDSKATLRTEAALLYELCGQFSDAARVSEPFVSADDTWRWCFERNAPGTEYSNQLRRRVTERASTATQQAERASGFIQAARLAYDAGDWAAEQSAIDSALRLDPNHLEGLLAAESLAFKNGDAERIAEVETLLAEAFPAPDSLAHARLAVRLLQTRGGSSAGYTLLLECAEGGKPSLDVMRRLAYVAPRMGDDELAYDMVLKLVPNAGNPNDRAILSLHAANLALKLGRAQNALSHAEQALSACSDYVPALSLKAQLLAAQLLHAEAAEAFERLGASARSRGLAGEAFKRAAEHLLKEGQPPSLDPASHTLDSDALVSPRTAADLPRLRMNLERALALLPKDAWVFECLVQTYTALKLQEPITQLFTSRLVEAEPEERRELGLRFAKACHALDADGRALLLVNEVLTQSPDDERALGLLARLAKTDDEREKALLQLVRVASSPAEQAAAYKQLGNFYRVSAPQALRAAKSFQEVLKRDPSDFEAVRALAELQIENRDAAAAEVTISTYAENARTPLAQHLVAVLRAVVVGAREPVQGAQLLEALIAKRPVDEVALSELAGLYVRTGQPENLAALVKRTRQFALQQIPLGDQLLESLKCVAELAKLTGEDSELLLARATFNLYHGINTTLDARGSRALSKHLDDLLAPAPLCEPVRAFLARTAHLWYAGQAPAEESRVTDKRIRAAFEMKARAASVPVPELFTSEKDPYSCVVTHTPPRVVLGATWVREAPQAVLDFLAWRCLKVLQAGAGAFVHLTNQDALLYVDALLRCFIDTQDVLVPFEQQLDNRALLRTESASSPEQPSLDVLATQVLEQLVQSELDLGDALRLWVNRSALLATGEPLTGLQYVALSNGELNTTITGDTVAFAARNSEARHLLRSLLADGVATAHRMIH